MNKKNKKNDLILIDEFIYENKPEHIDAYRNVCKYISLGDTITKAIEKNNNESENKITYCIFSSIRRKDKEMRDLYLMAIEEKAERAIDGMKEVINRLNHNKIDVANAKIIIETLKWMAQAYNSKQYLLGKLIDNSEEDNAIPQPTIILNVIDK